jgi:hypothetical protein
MSPNKVGMVAFILWASPANAHCYQHWHYPWPQHCGVSRAPVGIVRRAEEQDRSWYVEFVLPEDERNKAIDQLKVQLNKD